MLNKITDSYVKSGKDSLKSSMNRQKKIEELQEEQRKLRANIRKLNKDLENATDSDSKAALESDIASNKSELKPVSSDLRKLKKQHEFNNIARKTKYVEQCERDLAEANQRITDNNRLMFEDDIAARFPSTDPAVRRVEAQRWMSANKDSLPNFEDYNRVGYKNFV